MKFSFDCLYLDQHYSELFTYCMINNQLITNYSKEAIFTQEGFFDCKRKLYGIQKLLRLVVLFEKIDFLNPDPFDFSKVIEVGLMDSKNIAFSRNVQDMEIQLKGWAKSESDLVFELYKKQIIKGFKFKIWSDNPSILNALTKEKFDEYFEEYQMSGVYSEENDVYTFENLVKHWFHNSLSRYHFDLSICLDPKNNRTYCSDIIVDPIEVKSVKKRVDDVYYITKIRLPDEINVLPMPQTLRQAINMRNSDYVKSFRKVMKEWMFYLDNGDILLANKMKKDIIKANQNLERLERYKRYKESPFVRFCNLVGGFIPGLSEVLNVVNFSSSFIEDSIKKRNEWSLMPLLKNK